jgi:hypothetical protein
MSHPCNFTGDTTMNTSATASLASPAVRKPARRHATALAALVFTCLFLAGPSFAIDFTTLGSFAGPLGAALGKMNDLTPGIKALIGFVGFVVAFISLAALRNMGPVLFYLGMAIFGAVGLTIAGSIMSAVI